MSVHLRRIRRENVLKHHQEEVPLKWHPAPSRDGKKKTKKFDSEVHDN